MISVALLTPNCYNFDGVGVFVEHLAQELSRFYPVRVVAFHGNLRYPKDSKIQVTYLCARQSFLSNAKVVVDLVAGHCIDADVVFHEWAGGNSLFLYASQRKMKGNVTILDYHGVTPIEYTDHMRNRFVGYTSLPLLWATHRAYSHVVIHSHFVQEDFKRRFRTADVIPCGVDIEFFSPKERTKKNLKINYGFCGDEQVILYVGRVVKHKRVDFIVRALSILRQTSALKLKLLIVGVPDEFEVQRIRRFSESLGMNDHVIFAGRVSKELLPQFYHMADLFVTASIHEGFCIPIIEAMASGVPVIGSRCGSIPEVIGSAGITFNPFDVKELAASIKKLLTDDDLWKELSLAGIRRSKKFSWSRIGEAYRRYIELIAKPSPFL